MIDKQEPVIFTRLGLWDGLRQTLPIAIGAFITAIVFGVLAGQAGLSPLETIFMSATVFAGAAQFTVVGLWSVPLPIFTIILTTFVVNLRHLLMGAALHPWFSQMKPLPRYASIFLLTDETWALTIAYFNKGKRDVAFYVGSGLTMFAAWTSGTLVGRLAGSFLEKPAEWGLDFAFTAVFLALLVGMWKGKTSLIAWVVAAGVAVVASYLLPGKWFILVGGLVGSLVGAWQDDQ